jgi:alkylation response protein AidB-like acyl-CoA dehydrogenase
MISVEDFGRECRSWMAAHYERRPQVADGTFAWGSGSDDVGLFEELAEPSDVDTDEITEVRAWRKALDAAGLAWLTGPAEFGGRELGVAHQREFDAAVRHFDVPGNGLLMVSLGMIAPTILEHGTPDARVRYLRALHDGSLIACQLFSEPGAGSDLLAVGTRAVPVRDGWRVSGQKVWTSGAHFSDIGLVLCKSSDGERRRNLTMFVVDMRAPGMEVRPLRQMTGGAAFNEVFLEDVWVPDEDRLGDVDDGWTVALTTLRNERASIGGPGFGGVGLLSTQRYIEMAKALGRNRDPVIRDALARLVCELRVAKYNNLRTAANHSVGRAGAEGSFAKLALSRNYERITALVSQLLGPSLQADTGQWGTYAWSSFVLGATGMRIGGGTDEILLNAVAERHLGLPKEGRP